MQIKVNEVRNNNGTIHFESVSLEEAKRFIRDYNAQNSVVLELYDYDRTPVDHRKRV